MRTSHLAVAAVIAAAFMAGCGATTSTVVAGNPPHMTTAAVRLPSTPTTAASPLTTPAPSTTPASTTPLSTTAPTTSSTTTSGASYGQVNRSEPTAVAEALLTATFTSNTTTDTSPQDAVNRSLVWYTASQAATIRSEEPTGPPGAEWITWTAQHVITSVAITVNHDPGAPADTATEAYRQFSVTVTPHGSNGWTTSPDEYECFIVLTRPAPQADWQVASLETDQ